MVVSHSGGIWVTYGETTRTLALATANPRYLSGSPLDASADPPEQSWPSTGDLLSYLVLLEDRVSFNGRLDPVEESHFID